MKSSSSNALGKRPVGVDEDADVDDLDDVLDDFTPNRPAKPAPQTAAIPQTTTDVPRPPAAAASTTTKSPDAEATNLMEALALEMEQMFHQLGSSSEGPSSAANGASASGANAGHDAAREGEIRAAWEELFANSMADISADDVAAAAAGVGGGGKSDAPEEPEDAFQKIRDEAAERLRKSDAEQVVMTGLPVAGGTVRANCPSHRRVLHLHQMTTLPPCSTRGMIPSCKRCSRT